jgi:hypothetical protein
MSIAALPTDLPRRSFVHRKLVAHGARFAEINGGLLPRQDRDANEPAAAARPGLAGPSLDVGVRCP